ncbi:MAG: radical SAM protein [Deltaproteobacteria bacterium]|nr:radical SAM protein [Deltaproteobacteria bacterium]
MRKLDDAALHPVIKYLKNRIDSLSGLIQFEAGGEPIEIDAFRLRNLSAWAFEEYKSVFDSLGPLSGHCNLRCNFCYEKGNPLPYAKTTLSIQEARTRLRYYRQETRKGLPQFERRFYKEPFTNRDLIPILKMVRAVDPGVEISITTNGTMLDEKTIEELCRLVPINLSVSVNSSNPDSRKKIMGDSCSEASLRSLKKLKEHGLAFTGSIVAWPTLEMSDLLETIGFLDEHLARMIRITLPGYSRYYSEMPPFDTKQAWNAVLEAVWPLKEKIGTPPCWFSQVSITRNPLHHRSRGP